MATFAGITFIADLDGYSEKRDARVTVTGIPGGDNFYVDRAGRNPLTVTVGCLVDNDGIWGALNAAIGTQNTLAIEGLDSHSAVLTSVSRSKLFVGGQTSGTLEFTIMDA